MNAVIYARYSSSSQREASIEEQIKVCREYADRNEYHIIRTYNDNAITGKTNRRPALQQLLRDCTKGQFSIVLVYSIDRFGRNLTQSLLNEEKLSENGVLLYSATEKFTNDPAGRFFRNMMLSNAQYYVEELAEKIKRGMDYNAEKCLCTGGNIALGYVVDETKHFQINPDTAPIVQKIFEMYASGKTVTEIATYLNSKGVKTSRGVAFNKNSLHTILKNKRYIGIYTYKGKETPGGIPRIISDELFNQVAEIMAKNKKAPARARAKVEYLLTTKLFCGYCKEMMTGFSGSGKQGNVYRYYVCNGAKKKVCHKKMVRKEYIEDLVVSQCRKLLTTENINKIAKNVVAICEAEIDTSNVKHLKKLLAENERKYKNTIDAIMECDIESVRKTLYEKIPQLESEHAELEKEIAKEEAVLPTITVPQIKFFLTSLKKGNVNDMKYRRTLINIFVNKIFLYDDRMTITFNSGDEAVTINDLLLSEIEENDLKAKNLFLDSDGPPEKSTNFARGLSIFFCLLLPLGCVLYWLRESDKCGFSGGITMNEYNLKLNYYGLLNLHKALLEAKFHTMSDNEEVSESPFVASLYIQVRDLLMESDEGSQWKNWFQLSNRPDRRNQAILLMRKSKRWNKAAPDEKSKIACDFLAPFLFSEEELKNIIAEVDNRV